MWEMDKAAALRKLKARAPSKVPAGLGSLQGAAVDTKGRVGGTKKAKMDLTVPITHDNCAKWEQTSRSMEQRPCLDEAFALRSELTGLADSLEYYREKQGQIVDMAACLRYNCSRTTNNWPSRSPGGKAFLDPGVKC